MSIFYKDNTKLRKEFFTFIKAENRPLNYIDCESQLLEMLNRHRAQIYRAQVAKHISNLISDYKIDRAILLFNNHISERAPQTWVVYAIHYHHLLAFLAFLAVLAGITLFI